MDDCTDGNRMHRKTPFLFALEEREKLVEFYERLLYIYIYYIYIIIRDVSEFAELGCI